MKLDELTPEEQQIILDKRAEDDEYVVKKTGVAKHQWTMT